MSGPRVRFEHETIKRVDGALVVVVRRGWSDGAVTYGVQLQDGIELADEDYTAIPSDDQIRDLLAHHRAQNEEG